MNGFKAWTWKGCLFLGLLAVPMSEATRSRKRLNSFNSFTTLGSVEKNFYNIRLSILRYLEESNATTNHGIRRRAMVEAAQSGGPFRESKSSVKRQEVSDTEKCMSRPTYSQLEELRNPKEVPRRKTRHERASYAVSKKANPSTEDGTQQTQKEENHRQEDISGRKKEFQDAKQKRKSRRLMLKNAGNPHRLHKTERPVIENKKKRNTEKQRAKDNVPKKLQRQDSLRKNNRKDASLLRGKTNKANGRSGEIFIRRKVESRPGKEKLIGDKGNVKQFAERKKRRCIINSYGENCTLKVKIQNHEDDGKDNSFKCLTKKNPTKSEKVKSRNVCLKGRKPNKVGKMNELQKVEGVGKPDNMSKEPVKINSSYSTKFRKLEATQLKKKLNGRSRSEKSSMKNNKEIKPKQDVIPRVSKSMATPESNLGLILKDEHLPKKRDEIMAYLGRVLGFALSHPKHLRVGSHAWSKNLRWPTTGGNANSGRLTRAHSDFQGASASARV